MTDPPEGAVEFELWQAEYLIEKYPSLLKSYDTLKECWDDYTTTSP